MWYHGTRLEPPPTLFSPLNSVFAWRSGNSTPTTRLLGILSGETRQLLHSLSFCRSLLPFLGSCRRCDSSSWSWQPKQTMLAGVLLPAGIPTLRAVPEITAKRNPKNKWQGGTQQGNFRLDARWSHKPHARRALRRRGGQLPAATGSFVRSFGSAARRESSFTHVKVFMRSKRPAHTLWVAVKKTPAGSFGGGAGSFGLEAGSFGGAGGQLRRRREFG